MEPWQPPIPIEVIRDRKPEHYAQAVKLRDCLSAPIARQHELSTAQLTELGLAELSMGMTEDFELAIEEGATMVRVGRALFGPRL